MNEYFVLKASSKSGVLQKDDMDRWGLLTEKVHKSPEAITSKKSLETPLNNKLIKRKLSNQFRASFVNRMLFSTIYTHNTPQKTHV